MSLLESVAVADRSARERDPAVELLTRAKELVERGWSRQASALDAAGRQVEPWSEHARSWSLLGGLLSAWYEHGLRDPDAFLVAYTALAFATGGRVEEWNAARWRTRRHVIGVFPRACGFLPSARAYVRSHR